MKLFKIILILLTTVVGSYNATAGPEKKTIIFKVYGNCEMCKKTIEKSLEIKGVKSAVWNVETKMIEVVYVPELITETQIHEAIAKSGYDTELTKAKDEVYDKLPMCCHYRK